jgi:uncharacterized protein YbjT (DUF2867 family)
MIWKILVLGATGMLGKPVTRKMIEMGNRVIVLARDTDKAHQIFGNDAVVIPGSALNRENVRAAMAGCDAVHVSLPQKAELSVIQDVIDIGKTIGLKRITYISATTVCEENCWFDLINVKFCTESLLQSCGIASTIFCPTWAMETMHNFIRGNRAVLIVGRNPPPLHFVAAADLGKMVAASYEDNRALGKRLFVHGPESLTLPDAFGRFVNACYPSQKIMLLRLWQAKLIAKLTNNKELGDATRLIAYFDKVRELGDPAEANALFGAPSTTLDDWFALQKAAENI